jgi:hypothetical protein
VLKLARDTCSPPAHPVPVAACPCAGRRACGHMGACATPAAARSCLPLCSRAYLKLQPWVMLPPMTHPFDGGRRAVWDAKSIDAAPDAWTNGLRELEVFECPDNGVPTTETPLQSAAG